MKYKTSDLAKMLDVSDNTIRRFAEKGYLSSNRESENQYRFFGDDDIEKITYISKYRKIGFGHEEIASMLNGTLFENCSIYQNRMEQLEQEVSRLQSLMHMLKDDINMMRQVSILGEDFLERDSVPIYYFPYKVGGEIRSGKSEKKVLHRFIYDFPEVEYIYIIKKDDILNRRLRCEEAISIRAKLADKRKIDVTDKAIEYYPEVPSVLRIVRLPIDFQEGDAEKIEEAKKVLFDDFLEYMEAHGYRLAGDAVGVKIGFSKEEEKEMQYIVLGMPVEKVSDM